MSKRRLVLFLILSSLALAACEQFDDTPDGVANPDVTVEPITTPFAAPQGVAVAGDYVFVANPNWAFVDQAMVYNEGFVTVVRLADRKVVNKIPTTGKNPQALAAHGTDVWVLCSGETAFDGTTFVVSPATDATLERIDATTAATAKAPVQVIPVARSKSAETPLVGDPASIEISPDGKTAWLGSGTAAALFKVDLAAGKVLRGADNPVALGDLKTQDGLFLRNGPAGVLFVGSANRDQVTALDTTTDAPVTADKFAFATVTVGKSTDMERVADLVYRPGEAPDLYALMNLSNSISAVTTSAGQAGVRDGFASTGKAPNRMLLSGSALVVINSMDNNLQLIDPATGADRGIAVALPTGANPYDLAIVEGHPRVAYVSGNMSNSLFVVDLDGGSLLAEVK